MSIITSTIITVVLMIVEILLAMHIGNLILRLHLEIQYDSLLGKKRKIYEYV